MSAIITQNFRLDTTERFVDSLANNTFYIGLGRPNAWDLDANSVELPHLPAENDSTNNQVWQELYAMKKIASTDVIFASPRNTWASGTTYAAYDDKHTNIEGTQFMVLTANYNVFLCLKSGGSSTVDPDVGVGIQTSGVTTTSDGYVWKYMFTIPTDIANKFLTTEFVPVQKLSADPGASASQALQDQWAVQQGAVEGAIYNIAIDTAGSSYVSPTVTISGNGTGATATATVTSGGITDIIMTANGTGYDYATVTVTDSGGTGAVVRAVLSPKGGYGSNPPYDLRAHYIAFNKSFTGDESGVIPSANDFRQISLIKNPYEADGTTLAADDAYNTTKSLTVAAGGGFVADESILATDTGESGANGHVVEYDSTAGKLYYIQNESTGFTEFLTSDTIGSQNTTISAVNDSEIKFNSGEIMFVENRDPVTRGSSQVETIRLVIEF